jgi:hypothetical protein
MELVFRILAVILIGIAAYFLWSRNGDAAFISVVLGAVSFFLSIRFEVKQRLKIKAIEDEEAWQKEQAELAEQELLADELISDEPFSGDRQTTGEEQKARL